MSLGIRVRHFELTVRVAGADRVAMYVK